LEPKIKSKALARRFVEECQKRKVSPLIPPLRRAIEQVAAAAGKFYSEHKSEQDGNVDMPTFFKSQRVIKHNFGRFWANSNKERLAFEKQFAKAIEVLEE
jgi:hypothetical protein